MLVTKPYDRERAVAYARKWAFSQNPLFADFRGIGGNCTNFVSQAVYAGSCRMNYKPIYGWYYISLNERSASWAGVDYFYNFITGNTGEGPFGEEVGLDRLEVGDVIQLGRESEGYYHTVMVVGFEEEDPLIAAQTNDAFERPLSTYEYDYARYIKILGVRFQAPSSDDCFDGVYNGTALLSDAGSTQKPPMTLPSEETPEGGTATIPEGNGGTVPQEDARTVPEGNEGGTVTIPETNENGAAGEENTPDTAEGGIGGDGQ